MQIRSMFERYYSISDAFQEADAVARVTVGDWQGEDLHNWGHVLRRGRSGVL